MEILITMPQTMALTVQIDKRFFLNTNVKIKLNFSVKLCFKQTKLDKSLHQLTKRNPKTQNKSTNKNLKKCRENGDYENNLNMANNITTEGSKRKKKLRDSKLN